MKKPYGSVLDALRTQMASWSSIQTLLEVTGEGDPAAAAAAKIYQWGAPTYTVQAPPRITLDAESLNEEWRASHFTGSVQTEMLFEIPIPEAYQATDHAQKAWFAVNVVDAVLDDMNDNPGLLIFRSRQMTMPPGAVDKSELDSVLGNEVLWIWQQMLEIAT